jgi:predicted site-specific integrase-resolvase
MTRELLTKEEACELLRISSRTLDRWRSMWKARKVNPLGEVKIRKQPRFRREAVERLFTTPKLWLREA